MGVTWNFPPPAVCYKRGRRDWGQLVPTALQMFPLLVL